MPRARTLIQKPAAHEILLVCMEPEFESFLMACEHVIKNSLGVAGRNVPDWPRWKRNPDLKRTLNQAIAAARSIQPTPPVFRKIRGSMDDAKHEWAAYWLAAMFSDPKCKKAIFKHPLARRLLELLPQAPEP